MLIESEDQKMLRDALLQRLDVRVSIDARRCNDPNPVSWREACELGLGGILETGVSGESFGLSGVAVAAEVLGHTLTRLPFVGSGVLAPLLLQGAPDSLRERWSARLSEGRATFALALDDDPASGGATLQDGLLRARKRMVVDGESADLFGIVAPDDAGRPAVFAVQRDCPGVVVEPRPLIDGSSAAHVSVEGVAAVRVAGAVELERALNVARASISAELLGIATAVEERTLTHLRERRQFDRAIGSFQALQHRMAHLHTEIELARSIVAAAFEALAIDAPDADVVALVAKAKAGDVANFAAAEGVQMFGGMGMTDECDIGFYMKRARVASTLYGDSAWCSEQLARIWAL